MTAFNLKMPDDRLSRLIASFGRAALEARQIARRLGMLLTDRYTDLKREHARQGKVAHAERLALTDPRYLESIDELTSINAQARAARIQYETHMMLLDARRSLRRWSAAPRRPQSLGPRP